MEYDGQKLKKTQELYRLSPEEVAVEAKMSTSNLRKAYKNEAPVETRKTVAEAIETCFQRFISRTKCKSAG